MEDVDDPESSEEELWATFPEPVDTGIAMDIDGTADSSSEDKYWESMELIGAEDLDGLEDEAVKDGCEESDRRARIHQMASETLRSGDPIRC